MNLNPKKFFRQSNKRLIFALFFIWIHCRPIIAKEGKFCNKKMNKKCHIVCTNLNLNLRNDTILLEVITKEAKWMHSTCKLELINCSHTKKSNTVWNNLDLENRSKIKELKIINSAVDLGDTGLDGLKNLKRLTLINTTTINLNREIFANISNLRELTIQKNAFLKSVERNFLKGTQLKYIKIQGLNLNETETETFFSNLTGDFNIPSVRRLDWSFNNIVHIHKDFLKIFPNLNTLVLTNASITNIEGGAFNYGKIKKLHLRNNKLQKLPENVFKTIIENATQIFLSGNNLTCDCQMEWVQIQVNKSKGDRFGDFRKLKCARPSNSYFLDVQMCPKTENKFPRKVLNFNKSESNIICNATGVEVSNDYSTWQIEIDNLANLNKTPRRFNISNEMPELIEINISNSVNLEETFLWLMNFVNDTSPINNCLTISKHNFTVHVTPESNYLACLTTLDKFVKTHISDCLPFKTKPTYENQTWLKRKSIFLSVILITLLFLFASALGALILYLSIRKNPLLIRGSKRVILVKRHDKAQVLIMPRGCENLNQPDRPSQALMGFNQPLLTSRTSLNCDSVSTASYVSANQPTQLEILTYKLNRLQELFQECNEFPSPVAPLPVVGCPKPHQRLPPNVDLLFEYEWYTITTTTTS